MQDHNAFLANGYRTASYLMVWDPARTYSLMKLDSLTGSEESAI